MHEPILRIAFAGEGYREQLVEGDKDMQGLEVAAVESQLLSLLQNSPRVDVLVVDIPDPHAYPMAEVRALLEKSGAEMAVLVCGFAPRKALDALQSPQTKVMPGPLTISQLRLHLTSFIVKRLLAGSNSASRAEKCPQCGQTV